jgi:hypothetical protein
MVFPAKSVTVFKTRAEIVEAFGKLLLGLKLKVVLVAVKPKLVKPKQLVNALELICTVPAQEPFDGPTVTVEVFIGSLKDTVMLALLII